MATLQRMSELIPDLETIVGQFSDQKTYQDLIQIDPKTHTYDKLIVQESKSIPINDTLTLFNSYKIAVELIKANEDLRNELPLSIIGIMIPFVEFFDLKEYEDLQKYKVFVDDKAFDADENKTEKIALSRYILDIILKDVRSPFSDTSLITFYNMAGIIYTLISDTEKIYWHNEIFNKQVKSVEDENFIDKELYNDLSIEIPRALEYLVKRFPNLPLSQPKNYLDKLCSVMKFENLVHTILPNDVCEKYMNGEGFYDRMFKKNSEILYWNPVETYKDKIIDIIKNTERTAELE